MKLVTLDYVIRGTVYFQAENKAANQLSKLCRLINSFKAYSVQELSEELCELIVKEIARDVNSYDAMIQQVDVSSGI